MSIDMTEQPATKEDVRQIIREELRPVWKRIERHDREIYGHNGTSGLTSRVEQNTQHSRRMTWHLRAIWTAALGSIVAFVTGKPW